MQTKMRKSHLINTIQRDKKHWAQETERGQTKQKPQHRKPNFFYTRNYSAFKEF
jgi:hypothetical protein